MNREKLNYRELPFYTKGEEIFNMVSHIVGGVFAVAILVLCVVFSVLYRDAWAVVASSIYGAILIMIYVFSAIYHGLHVGMAKKIFDLMLQFMPFYLVSATITPVAFVELRYSSYISALILFLTMWICTMIGNILVLSDIERYGKVIKALYIVMGAVLLALIVPIYGVLNTGGMIFFISGCLAYGIGGLFYFKGKVKVYMHSIYHLCVVAGSILHFFMILFYVIMQ